MAQDGQEYLWTYKTKPDQEWAVSTHILHCLDCVLTSCSVLMRAGTLWLPIT